LGSHEINREVGLEIVSEWGSFGYIIKDTDETVFYVFCGGDEYIPGAEIADTEEKKCRVFKV
jgi:hypothetical protein